ncbi:hypothetical protein FXO38_23555 [Capsicum annuum]|nr:hypothetical protein FXO38_23555 [Capsicum annuum]
MQFRWTKKKKSSDKEPFISTDVESSSTKDPRKNKCFICHDKGHFAKGCPKSKKVKREARSFMACPEDIGDPHPTTEDISISTFSAEKGTSEDIFIRDQPHAFTSRQLSNANYELHASEWVEVDEDALQHSIQMLKEECPSML